MGTNLYFGIRMQPDKYERVLVENVDLEDSVLALKKRAAERVNALVQNIEFIYCGLALEDTWTLSACGVEPGVTIHVLEKPKPQVPQCDPIASEVQVEKIVAAFRTFTSSAGYRNALQRLSRPEILEKVIAATPGLEDDPVAIAVIRDPELISQLSDPVVVRRAIELHPPLIAAAHHIAAHIHEDTENVSQNSAGTSTGYSYSLGALSDDDNDDESESSHDNSLLTRNSSFNTITAAQVAAAIANASSGASPNTPTNNVAGASSSELFNNATASASATSNRADEINSVLRHLQPQMQQMREMGLLSNAINFRALQTTSGDLQAAVELVLSGAFE